MILAKKDILKLAKDSSVKLLGDDFDENNMQGSSYDLRIGAVFKEGRIISEEHNVSENWNIQIKPSQIITFLTLEEVNIPLDICATVFPINKQSSRGLLILNPGHIDPGYRGPISVCAINLSKETKTIKVRETKIFTIIFNKLTKKTTPYILNQRYLLQTRAAKEQNFLTDKSSLMSSSIFELIKENEYEPFLKKLVNDTINKKLIKVGGWVVSIIFSIITITGVIIAALSYNHDVSKDREIKDKDEKIRKSDSIIKVKDSVITHNINTKDS